MSLPLSPFSIEPTPLGYEGATEDAILGIDLQIADPEELSARREAQFKVGNEMAFAMWSFAQCDLATLRQGRDALVIQRWGYPPDELTKLHEWAR